MSENMEREAWLCRSCNTLVSNKTSICPACSAERPEEVDIIPNMHRSEECEERISLANYAKGATWWITDADYALRKVADGRKRVLESAEDSAEAERLARRVTSRQILLNDLMEHNVVLLKDLFAEAINRVEEIAKEKNPDKEVLKEYDADFDWENY